MTELYEKLRKAVAELELDVIKAEHGNAAAGRRIRVAVQEIKIIAQDLRLKTKGE